MIKAILQLLFILVVAWIVTIYYGLVLPVGASGLLGVAVAVVMSVSLLLDKISLKTVLFGSVSLAVWPAGALIVSALFPSAPPAVTLAGAFPAAAVAGHFTYALAEKRDRARDVTLFTLVSIAIYTLIASINSGDRLAIALACANVGLLCGLTRQQLIAPPEVEDVLLYGSYLSVMLAGVHLLVLFMI